MNESLVNTTYMNLEHITRLNLVFLRSFGLGERGNLWITELIITYDGRPVNVVSVMEFRDGKVAHETHYYADPFEPPQWRSQWNSLTKDNEYPNDPHLIEYFSFR